jgi:hypothetical protein
VNKRFEETGSVCNLPTSGRRKSVVTEQNEMAVATALIQSPHKSKRKGSSELGISRTSYQRILKHLKLKPYRPRLLHALHLDDPDRRVEFCELYLIRHEDNPDFSKSILWTHEALFQIKWTYQQTQLCVLE